MKNLHTSHRILRQPTHESSLENSSSSLSSEQTVLLWYHSTAPKCVSEKDSTPLRLSTTLFRVDRRKSSIDCAICISALEPLVRRLLFGGFRIRCFPASFRTGSPKHSIF